jgi:hypothetical protein
VSVNISDVHCFRTILRSGQAGAGRLGRGAKMGRPAMCSTFHFAELNFSWPMSSLVS